MWLVDRHAVGRRGGRIALPFPVREALVRWYVGQGTKFDEEAGITLVQQARIGGKWLVCDCLGPDAAPPILTPAYLSEAETYYLRRLTGPKRPSHQPDCPFFRDQATHRISEVRSRATPADPPTGFFEVLRPAPEKLARRPTQDACDDRTRHGAVPRLARLLWRLLDTSGRNRCPPLRCVVPTPTIAREFAALRAAASRIEAAPGVELGRVLWTHGAALHAGRVQDALSDLAERWPAGHAPQGFVIVFAPAVRGQIVEPAGCAPIRVANRIQSPSVRSKAATGPFLVIIVVGQYPEARGYAPLRAYAQPIYSGQRFVPVESILEREALRQLLRAQFLLDQRGIDLAIEKPVFDLMTPTGTCRPEFVVDARCRANGEIKRLVVQIAERGLDTAAASTTASLAPGRIAPILTISAREIEQGGVPQALTKAICR